MYVCPLHIVTVGSVFVAPLISGMMGMWIGIHSGNSSSSSAHQYSFEVDMLEGRVGWEEEEEEEEEENGE